jgi:hypothetical protein
MASSFTEISPIANSYWAEMIGLYSIHVFIKALYEHFSSDSRSVEICCDNEMALTEAVGHPKQVSTGTASVNVFRGIRAITRTNTKIQWKYTWVKAHMDMDEVLLWSEQTRPPQQLNVMCNALAKQLQKSNGDPVAPTCHLLPLEHCTVFIGKVKQTSDPATRLL